MPQGTNKFDYFFKKHQLTTLITDRQTNSSPKIIALLFCPNTTANRR